MQGRDVIADILIDNPNADEETIKQWFEQTAEKLYEQEEKKNQVEDETEESDL